jgi:L-lactate dehydrogenase complex protein LldF
LDRYRQFLEEGADRAADQQHAEKLDRASATHAKKVLEGASSFRDWSAAKSRARAIRINSLERMGPLLEEFEKNAAASGARVHWAEDDQEACALILSVLAESGVRLVVKSKSMTIEEIGLGSVLEREGIAMVETDLGEFIQQLSGEAPYHIVSPAIHRSRQEIGRLFERVLGIPYTDRPETLTRAARDDLRGKFLTAGAGLSGANALVAETGQVAVTENEGNARLGFSLPGIHIVVAGIEKILPRLSDLFEIWPVLATAGTGQRMTSYNTLLGGPAEQGEAPGQYHIILLDNGRSAIHGDPVLRESLLCLRCGACLNVCPIYRTVGGHVYKGVYPGPIGAVLMPALKPRGGWEHLPFASTLCGACEEICPVGIQLPKLLLEHRRRVVASRPKDRRMERVLFRVWTMISGAPAFFEASGRLARVFSGFPYLWRLPNWSRTRILPRPAAKSFRRWMKEKGGLRE